MQQDGSSQSEDEVPVTGSQSLLGKRKHDGNLVKSTLDDIHSDEEEIAEGGPLEPEKGQRTLTGFLKNQKGEPLIMSTRYKRKKKHPLSLWRDETLVPRQLETDETIFDIIMPWVSEQRRDLDDKAKKLKKESVSCKKPAPKQSSLGSFFKATSNKSTPGGGKKSAPQQQQQTPMAETPSSEIFDEAEQLEMLSRVHKIPKVSEFNWSYKDSVRQKTVQLKDLQCILINPKWADHGKQIYGEEHKKDVKEVKAVKGDQRREAFAGLTIEEFKKLRIPSSVMKDGILFIWAEKELIGDIVFHFEDQGFQYVENMVYVMLDPTQKKSVESYKNTDATPAIARQPYHYLRKSHKTLLMLRRTHERKTENMHKTKQYNNLELRHQRTGDVVFDWTDDADPFKKPEYYTFKLIETLLPKAMNKLPKAEANEQHAEQMRAIKMVELWAAHNEPRKGWLKVMSLSGN